MNSAVTKRRWYHCVEKHITNMSNLVYAITSRDVTPTELAGEQQLTRWMFSSNRDYRTYLSPLQLKGTVELVAVSQLSSYQPAKPFSSSWAW